MDTPQNYPTVWTSGYLANGMKVSFTFPIRNEMDAYNQALTITNKLIADGFTTHDPRLAALAAGEDRDSVGYVLRYDKKNNSGNVAPCIALYPDSDVAIKKYLWVYLDTPEQIEEFETATGVKVNSMAVWPSKQPPDRDETAAKYFSKVKPGVKAVFKANPDWSEDPKDKFVPKRIFVRWERSETTPPTPPAATAGQPVNARALPPLPTHQQVREEADKAITEIITDADSERMKALAEPPRNARLENKELVITRMVKTGMVTGNKEASKNGPKYDGWGKINDGGSFDVRVWIFPENLPWIKEAGWDFHEGTENHIPIIMDTTDRAMTRIKVVIPREQATATERTWDAAAWKAVQEYAESFEEDLTSILGVSKGSDWKRGYNAAIKAIDVFVANRNGIDFMADGKKTA